MNNTYQLYLKLNSSEDGLLVKNLLTEVGFANFKQTGTNLGTFRNYYFRTTESPNQFELHFRILPNETKISTIALQLYFSCPSNTLKNLFARLSLLEKILPFQLLDLELRNRNYSELHKNSRFTKSAVVVHKKQQDSAEKTAYIPISFNKFILNGSNVDKRQRFFVKENNKGEKAPDDQADQPRAKSN